MIAKFYKYIPEVAALQEKSIEDVTKISESLSNLLSYMYDKGQSDKANDLPPLSEEDVFHAAKKAFRIEERDTISDFMYEYYMNGYCGESQR